MKNETPCETFSEQRLVVEALQQALDTVRLHGLPPPMDDQQRSNLGAWLGWTMDKVPSVEPTVGLVATLLVRRCIDVFGGDDDVRH